MTLCVVHQDHEADEGWLVCRRAWGRLAGSLRQIPGLCDDLEERSEEIGVNFADPVSLRVPAGPTRASWSQSRIRSTRPERLPIRVDVTDLLGPVNHAARALLARSALGLVEDQDGYVSVATVLDYWAVRWAWARNEHAPWRSGERSLVAVQCGWLLDRLDWACRYVERLPDFADDVTEISGKLYGLANGGRVEPKAMEAICPGCRLVTLVQYYPDANIECVTTDCRRILTPDEYAEHVRLLIEESTTP